MTKLATLLAAGAAFAAAVPAAAQVNGIATTSPEIVIARSAARGAAYQQIGQTYQAQITQIGTIRNEINTLIKSMDTNNDNQLSDAERAAKPAVITQIQQKEQQLAQISQPISLAQAYVLDQIAREYNAARQQVISDKKIQIMLAPDAIEYAPPAVDVTDAIVTALDARKPTATTAVPAGWQPSQQIAQLAQSIQQILVAAAQQQAATAQQAQPGQQQPAQQQPARPAGR